MAAKKSSSAFTLIELLVAIAIIAVIIALLMPAVQAAREAARRTECKNHIHQLLIAMHNYHDVARCFPAGIEIGEGPAVPALWSWQVKLLPQCEAQPTYDRLIALGNVGAAAKAHVLAPSELLPMLRCPSESGPQSHREQDGLFADEWLLTNYLGVSGADAVQTVGEQAIMTLEQCSQLARKQGLQTESGVFFEDSEIGISDITDGTTNTIVIGERGIPPNGDHGWWTGPGLADSCPGGWTDVVLPADDRFGFAGLRPQERAFTDAFHWWSYHPGVANFGVADGSVHAISEAIDKDTLKALSTRAGRETISASLGW